MSNIELGIDLGTTNSELAIMIDGNVEIVKNNLGDEYTPSVFGIAKNKNEIVGKKAHENLNKLATTENVENTIAEVKRIMGTKDKIKFSRIDKSYTPEEVSAEILKSLKKDAIAKKKDINTNGVVITIPAHFTTVQSEATKRAGLLAGFNYVVLLQEPIAAAISYGFNNSKNENWLVYDLGGGTFDVALISSKDGNLKVLSHNGDNFLGGKDIDTKIIDEIVIPEIVKNNKIKSFNRSNKKYADVFPKIKYTVEQAKIQLSRADKTDIEIELEIDGEDIFLNIPLGIDVLADICKPIIDNTIMLTKKTIKESGLKKDAINKILLIGGPTQLPFVRTQLESILNIPVDTSPDPLTSVAKGACVFGASQQIPDHLEEEKELDENVYSIKLDFETLSSEEDELITGVIEELKDIDSDYFIQIQSHNNVYNSGKIKLKNGKFVANVSLEAGKINQFWIYLFDKDGNSLSLSKDNISITQGLSIAGSPLPNSIGVAILKTDSVTGIAQHKADWFFKKNDVLPLTKMKRYKTVRAVSKGDKVNILPIIIFEGESDNPDRNTYICELKITGDMLPYDLPQGSDVEITISVDESRTVRVDAYIPDIDASLDARSTIYDENVSVSKLNTDLNEEQKRFDMVKDSCMDTDQDYIESNINEIKDILASANSNEDDKRKANAKLKRLKSDLDDVSKHNTFAELVREFEFFDNNVSVFKNVAEDDVKDLIDDLVEEGQKAIDGNNEKKLASILKQIREVKTKCLTNDKSFLMMYIAELYQNPLLQNDSEAVYFFNKAQKSFDENDVFGLRQCISSLLNLLPVEERENMDNKLSGITC